MSIPQEGNVVIFQTPDDGELNLINGLIEMSGGIPSAAYLSLFGGNEEDDGLEGNSKTWWGNIIETEKARKYISETQYLLRSIPATSGNLLRLEDAAKRDLAWFIESGVATSVTVSTSIIGLNMVQFNIEIDQEKINFTENWGEQR
jgi:phage gp46-like protein